MTSSTLFDGFLFYIRTSDRIQNCFQHVRYWRKWKSGQNWIPRCKKESNSQFVKKENKRCDNLFNIMGIVINGWMTSFWNSVLRRSLVCIVLHNVSFFIYEAGIHRLIGVFSTAPLFLLIHLLLLSLLYLCIVFLFVAVVSDPSALVQEWVDDSKSSWVCTYYVLTFESYREW